MEHENPVFQIDFNKFKTQKPKAKRHRLSSENSRRMQAEWDRVMINNNGFLEPDVAEWLSRDMNVTIKQVKKWFTNRRYRLKKLFSCIES